MKEHPILFSAPMVRAILEGRKTITRRVVKFPMHTGKGRRYDPIQGAPINAWWNGRIACPYGQPGDRLWVRETWDFRSWERDTVRISYGAGGLQEDRVPPSRWNPTVYNYERWRPSIHMPRWASRIDLEITAVRVERLQDISDEDCEAEGVRPSVDGTGRDWRTNESGWIRTFRQLWDSINAKRGYGWDANPWVWVLEFKRVDP